jgi:hypothetical protein
MSASEIAAVLREQVKLKGMRWFQKLRAEIAGYHQAYMDQPYGAKGHGWRPALGIDMDTLEKKYELSREVMGYH